MLKKIKILSLFVPVLCLVLLNCTKKEPPCKIIGPAEHAYLKTGPIEGGVLLPNGLSITPVGKQITVGGFPMNLILTPDNKTLIVTNNGYGINKTQSLSVIDVDKMTVRQTVSKGSDESYFLGLAIKSDGTRLYASGGGNNKVWVYDITGGELTNETYIPVDGYPGGLTLSQDEKLLYVAQNLANKIAVVDLTIASPTVTSTTEVGQYPYDIVLTQDGSKAYVSNWGERTVSVIDTSDHKLIDTITVGKNPEDMVLSPDGKKLYVTNSDTDNISVINIETDKVINTISVDLRSDAPMGSSPNALYLSPDGKTLYVASAGTNSIDVISTEEGKLLGRIPTGWYPTGVILNNDGSRLFVANAKGVGSGPNPGAEYVGGMMPGTVSTIPTLLISNELDKYTDQVDGNNNRLSKYYTIECDRPDSPIPAKVGGPSPIKHVVFIVRENKTYDQVLGDFPGGDGDPNLTMFGEWYTPNLHKLAREFTTFDNFYSDAEVSVQGHMWHTASISTDYVEKTWIAYYRDGTRVPAPGIEPAGYPEAGFMFHHCLRHNVDFINYGQMVGVIGELDYFKDHVDPNWPGGVVWNMSVKDVERAEYFAEQIKKGIFPPFVFILLPNDHTHGFTPGKPTPQSMVADNDEATGMIVEAISHSPYWKETAIFITEDDPQSGADHVDAHRTICLVISPYAKRGYISRVHYSVPSIFKTMELILGLPPMNKYDERAAPMYDCFTSTPDYTPYDAVPRYFAEEFNLSLKQMNPELKVLAEECMEMDFSVPDSVENDRLGEVLRKGLKIRNPLLQPAEEPADE